VYSITANTEHFYLMPVHCKQQSFIPYTGTLQTPHNYAYTGTYNGTVQTAPIYTVYH